MSGLAKPQFQPYQTLNPYSNNPQTLEQVVLTIPAGTTIPATTNNEINTHFLIVGQGIHFMLAQDYYYGNKLVAPIGSTINGTVIQVKNAAKNANKDVKDIGQPSFFKKVLRKIKRALKKVMGK